MLLLVFSCYQTDLSYPAEGCYYYIQSIYCCSDLRQTTILLFACSEIYSASLVNSWIKVILQQFEIFIA